MKKNFRMWQVDLHNDKKSVVVAGFGGEYKIFSTGSAFVASKVHALVENILRIWSEDDYLRVSSGTCHEGAVVITELNENIFVEDFENEQDAVHAKIFIHEVFRSECDEDGANLIFKEMTD